MRKAVTAWLRSHNYDRSPVRNVDVSSTRGLPGTRPDRELEILLPAPIRDLNSRRHSDVRVSAESDVERRARSRAVLESNRDPLLLAAGTDIRYCHRFWCEFLETRADHGEIGVHGLVFAAEICRSGDCHAHRLRHAAR